VRVGFDPGALPVPVDGPGPNRYDDPRPRTLDRYLMRYTARTVRGSLLELLDHLRPPDAEAAAREAGVEDNDDSADQLQDGRVPGGLAEPWQHVQDFLAGRHVATLQVDPSAWVVSVHDPTVQATLDAATGVRALLDSPTGRQALLPAGAEPSAGSGAGRKRRRPGLTGRRSGCPPISDGR